MQLHDDGIMTSGDGYVSGYGDGSGYGSGYGSGDGSGYGDGDGDGDGWHKIADAGDHAVCVEPIWGTVKVGCIADSIDGWAASWEEVAADEGVELTGEQAATILDAARAHTKGAA